MKIALLLAALAAPLARAEPTLPTGNLSGLVGVDDYPMEALQRGEQGTVQVRLAIGVDGRVKGCEVVGSSKSESLDARTCEIMIERARFTPARDASGRPVEGSFTQRITWRIYDDGPQDPVLNAAAAGWFGCVMNGALPQIGGTLAPETIAETAYAACKPLEAGIEAAAKVSKLPNMNVATMMRSLKQSSLEQIRQWTEQARAAPDQAAHDKT